MPRLFHVSETPDIATFDPRPVPSPDAGVTGDAVWAIDEARLPNYLLPRDCPRVAYAAGLQTDPRDIADFFDNTSAKRIVVVEQAWLTRILQTVLYVYEMPPAGFELADANAGYYICRTPVTPAAVYRVDDFFGALAERDCELRLVPDLSEIRENVRRSTLEYSFIRMRNARKLG